MLLCCFENISKSLSSFEFSFAKRVSPGFTWGSLAHFQLKLKQYSVKFNDQERMILAKLKLFKRSFFY